jgi:hypothetical protein
LLVANAFEHARPSTGQRTTHSFFTLADGALCWIPWICTFCTG